MYLYLDDQENNFPIILFISLILGDASSLNYISLTQLQIRGLNPDRGRYSHVTLAHSLPSGSMPNVPLKSLIFGEVVEYL